LSPRKEEEEEEEEEGKNDRFGTVVK